MDLNELNKFNEELDKMLNESEEVEVKEKVEEEVKEPTLEDFSKLFMKALENLDGFKITDFIKSDDENFDMMEFEIKDEEKDVSLKMKIIKKEDGYHFETEEKEEIKEDK